MPELQSLVVNALNAADLLTADTTVLHLLRGRQDGQVQLRLVDQLGRPGALPAGLGITIYEWELNIDLW